MDETRLAELLVEYQHEEAHALAFWNQAQKAERERCAAAICSYCAGEWILYKPAALVDWPPLAWLPDGKGPIRQVWMHQQLSLMSLDARPCAAGRIWDLEDGK